MRRPSLTTLSAGALALAAFFVPGSARALDRGPYSVEILVDGAPVAEYAARGRTYVEALRGREYSIRLRNDTGQRVAVALSVDGLNSIDAKTTTAVEARKWILDPWSSIVLDGWQTSSATARRFYFTSEADSYGAWLGKTKNLGVVAAAFFRERRPDPPALGELRGKDEDRQQEIRCPKAAPGDRGAPAAQRPEAQSKRGASADEMAATGIGREVGHPVRTVGFDPEDAPASTLQLRYEYRDALVRLGVLPQHDDALARREAARGFEESGFAPDPYRRRSR